MSTTTRTILIADDCVDDVFFLERALREAKINRLCRIVKNGAEVVSYLNGEWPFSDRSRYPFPELIFLDIKMPILNGFEVLEWWRKWGKNGKPPIIILSGSSLPDDVERARALGAAAYE
jgi:CheY-like chemotaxis protein